MLIIAFERFFKSKKFYNFLKLKGEGEGEGGEGSGANGEAPPGRSWPVCGDSVETLRR